MDEIRQLAKLSGVMGKCKGLQFVLEKMELEVGSGPECDIILRGARVAPLHAVLRYSSNDEWRIISKTDAQIIVNKLQVEEQQLFSGDKIQFGSENLLEFSIEKKQRRLSGGSEDGKDNKGKYVKQIAVFVLPLYLLIGVGVWLLNNMDSREGDVKLNQEGIEAVVKETEGFLRGMKEDLKKNGKEGEGVDGDQDIELILLRDGFRASGFRELLTLDAAATEGEDSKERVDLIATIVAETRESLFQVWLLESQGRTKEAIRKYTELIDTLPDVRYPLTKFAVQHRQQLRDKIK